MVLNGISTSRPGDFDGDGDIDGPDFLAWQTNLPQSRGGSLDQGDADGDNDIDGADFVVWQTNFPYTPEPSTSPAPEPQAILLGLLAVAGVTAARLRGKRVLARRTRSERRTEFKLREASNRSAAST